MEQLTQAQALGAALSASEVDALLPPFRPPREHLSRRSVRWLDQGQEPAASGVQAGDGAVLTLQLHFVLEVRSLCFGLMSASPERPCDDASGLDAPLRELEGDATDFLDRPADQERRLIDRRCNVFLGHTTAALAR